MCKSELDKLTQKVSEYMNAVVDVTYIKLETERLLIRPWEMDDLQDFFDYAKVDGVGQMAGWNPHTSIEESRMILSSFIKGKMELAIVFRENHKVIGSIGLEELSLPMSTPYDSYIGREIGYALNKCYWGMGIMPEAVQRIIQYCFAEENYDFLLCSHAVTNHQSRRVIEKCGFCYLLEKKERQSMDKYVSPSIIFWRIKIGNLYDFAVRG